jgi:hypothetical protein
MIARFFKKEPMENPKRGKVNIFDIAWQKRY